MTEADFAAAQAFLLAVKRHWTTQRYPTLRAMAQASLPPQADATQVADALEPTTAYQTFAWLERHLQKMKYSGAYGLAPYHEARHQALLQPVDQAVAQAMAASPPRLTLNPKLPMPAYYQAVDIHQHPQGLSSHPLAGLIYERGARSTTPMLGARHQDLHTRFTDVALSLCTQPPARVIDLACGFGKSTLPFAHALPQVSITALDLSAPCLKTAVWQAAEQGIEHVHWLQANACATGLPDASANLVTSTMLLHELPTPQLHQALAESARLCAPGGHVVHLDFWLIRDGFDRFIYNGHSDRNNEPFMKPLFETDVAQAMERVGLVDVKVLPFAEAEGVDPAAHPHWRFPWTVITGRRPSAAA